MGFTLVNYATATVATQSNSGSTSLVVGTGLGAQFATATTANPIRCGAFDSTGALKFYFDVTARSTDTLTVANRGAESTTDANILTTDVIDAVATRDVLNVWHAPAWSDKQPSGASFETVPRQLCSNTNTQSNLQLLAQAIWLPAGLSIGHIAFASGGTSQTTPSNWYFLLLDSSGVLLATTADQTTTVWVANTVTSLAVAKTAAGVASTFTTTYSGLHFVGLVQNATARANLVSLPVPNTGLADLNPRMAAFQNGFSSTPPAFPFTATLGVNEINIYGYVGP